MQAEIRSHEPKGSLPKRVKRRWILRIWLASWVLWGPSVQAEILYDEEGVQLHGTARIVAYNAATCHVLEESHTEAHYEQIKANDGQPLHVWRLDYSVHNRTGKGLSYLRADFEIESGASAVHELDGGGTGRRRCGRTLFRYGVLGQSFQNAQHAGGHVCGEGGAGGIVLGRVSHGPALIRALVDAIHLRGGGRRRPTAGTSVRDPGSLLRIAGTRFGQATSGGGDAGRVPDGSGDAE